jgi:hypothetical protein
LVLYKPKGSKAEVHRVVLVFLGLVGLRLELADPRPERWLLVDRVALLLLASRELWVAAAVLLVLVALAVCRPLEHLPMTFVGSLLAALVVAEGQQHNAKYL